MTHDYLENNGKTIKQELKIDLMASILGLFYLLINISYQQGIYEKMIEDYKKNNTELITDYNNCIGLIDTNNNDLYDTIRGIFSLCNVPISYLKKMLYLNRNGKRYLQMKYLNLNIK